MRIRELDGDDPATVELLLPGFARTMAVDLPGDPPVPPQLLARLLQRRRGADRLVLAALDIGGMTNDGEALGYTKLGMDLAHDLDRAHGSLWVFPPHRRRGVGRQLITHTAERLRALGRDVLLVDAPCTLSADAFAAATGGRRTGVNLRNRLQVRGWQPPRAPEPGDLGVKLVRWNERCPAELVDGYARAWSQLDVPVNGQAASGSVTATDVRAAEEESRRAGHRQYAVAAVCGDGEVLGYSTAFVRDSPMGDVGQTLVVAGQRRRGLGTLLKRQLISWVQAENPQLTVLQAWNRSQDEAVLALNRRIGFRADQQWATYRFDVASIPTPTSAPEGLR